MESNNNKPEIRDEKKTLTLDNAAIEAELLRPGRSWFYQLAVNLLTIVTKLLFFVRVEGKENIPEGACVIMGNHRAWLDPFLLAMCARDREIRFMGKKELWGNKLFAWIAKQVRGVPVDRGNADMASIRMSMTVLKNGHTLGIFPEGTRTKGDGMMPLQGGASLLALRSKCAVVPVYIDGDYKLFHRVTVRVGKPVQMDDLLAGRINKDTCDALTERIKAAFAELSGGRSLMAPVKDKKENCEN
ncbi:MAG: 1-acyl-sn-glycerol-3-phosphate acyltransferase [Clostridiales bacterium]|nr:1-acyl-sn-glycerol-3-phosphate acyltransferase [Clostridiales bacterium]